MKYRRLKTSIKSLVSVNAICLSLAFSNNAHAQLVSAGDLVGSADSSGATGVLSITNPIATMADINVNSAAVVSDFTRFNVPTGTSVNINVRRQH